MIRCNARPGKLCLQAGLLACVTVLASVASPADWHPEDGYRWMELAPRGSGGFSLISAEQTGIGFTNRLSESRGLTNQIYYSGSGVAAGDVDGDGRPDLYFCSLESRNSLQRNLGGWRFEDVTADAGVECPDQPSTGAVLGDVDGDGDVDLLVSALGHGVRLFINNGTGTFQETTEAAGLAGHQASMTMTLADVEGDGDLDLYVANYRSHTVQDEVNVSFEINTIGGERQIVAVNGRPASSPELAHRFTIDEHGTVLESGEPDDFYLNDGHGRFQRVPWEHFLDENGKALSEPPRDWGLSAMFRDMNGDGAPDLYVCNDSESPDRVWINSGLGRFQALSLQALRETSLSSMGVDFADIDRDGNDDFFVADMLGFTHATLHTQMPTRRPLDQMAGAGQRPAFPRNTLFRNRGNFSYAEIAQWAGVDASDWSWAPVFLDVDLDGFEDLLITTGLERNLRDADARAAVSQLRRSKQLSSEEFLAIRERMGRLEVPNHAFRNTGALRFEPAGDSWNFNSLQSSHGIALADLDQDGDLDVVVACLNAQPLLYRNEAPAPRLAVRLNGRRGNRHGIGARIEVQGGPVSQSQEMAGGGRYLSSDDFQRVFACGTGEVFSVRVRWRGGGETQLRGLKPNRLYEFDEPEPVYLGPPAPPPPPAPTLFQDLSGLVDQLHVDVEYSDFNRQPMLTRRLSIATPGISWGDWTRDGHPDLILTPGRGGEFTVMAGDGLGFRHLQIPAFAGRAIDDIGSALIWPLNDRTNLLFFSQGTFESANDKSIFGFALHEDHVRRIAQLPAWNASVSALAAGDVDGDGDLDLVAGGRFEPGRYPASASSRLLRNDAGHFTETAALAKVGLVNGVILTDLDGDGRPELVLSSEWDSLRVFKHNAGELNEVTAALGLDRFTGWWQGVASGDFDGDGRLDLVAGNWGGNHRYQRFASQPLAIFHADLDGDGVQELFEAYHDPTLNRVVPSRTWDTLSGRLAFLNEQIHSFRQFSLQGVDELLGNHQHLFQQRSAATLRTALFLNRGDRFEHRPLPDPVQWAPVFGITVADWNGDGNEDLFLAQNFSGSDRESSWSMAGQGVVLLGDGQGGFEVLDPERSGVRVEGDARGAAVADYDSDGRPDLAVGQHNGWVKLYRNQGGAPGLVVRLQGEADNWAAVGASLRAIYRNGQTGPVHEIRAGSGWLSQDDFAVVLSPAAEIASVQVRWPGGRTTQTALPPSARLLIIKPDGTLAPSTDN